MALALVAINWSVFMAVTAWTLLLCNKTEALQHIAWPFLVFAIVGVVGPRLLRIVETRDVKAFGLLETSGPQVGSHPTQTSTLPALQPPQSPVPGPTPGAP